MFLDDRCGHSCRPLLLWLFNLKMIRCVFKHVFLHTLVVMSGHFKVSDVFFSHLNQSDHSLLTFGIKIKPFPPSPKLYYNFLYHFLHTVEIFVCKNPSRSAVSETQRGHACTQFISNKVSGKLKDKYSSCLLKKHNYK